MVKKKVLLLESKEIDAIDNSDIYNTYKDFYLSEKEVKRSFLKVYNQEMV